MQKLKIGLVAVVYSVMLFGFLGGGQASAKTSFQIKFPKPKAKIEKFQIAHISLRDITFLFDISITNPYPVDLKLAGIDLEFFIEGHTLMRASTSKGFVVKRNGKKINQFYMTIVYKDMAAIIKEFNERDFLDLDIDVAVHIPLPKMKGLPKKITLDFKLHKKIPAVRPKVEVVNFKVHPPTIGQIDQSMKKKKNKGDRKKKRKDYEDFFNGKTVKGFKPQDLDLIFNVSFDIIITNETKAKLDFSDLNFNFLVNKKALVAGRTDKVKRTDNSVKLTVMNQFSSRNLSKQVESAFKKRKGTFTLVGDTLVSFPRFVSKNKVRLKFVEDGTFNFR